MSVHFKGIKIFMDINYIRSDTTCRHSANGFSVIGNIVCICHARNATSNTLGGTMGKKSPPKLSHNPVKELNSDPYFVSIAKPIVNHLLQLP